MIFKDYFDLIKKYCKKITSDEDLCRDLFNSIIENVDDEGFYDFDKTVVSRILKGQRNIPNIVREHVYDEEVVKNIDDYFTEFIIIQLIPDHSDLIHELVMLLEKYPNISKAHLTTLKSLAKEKTLGMFLSEVFRYSIIEGTIKTSRTKVSQETLVSIPSIKANEPKITLSGISRENHLIDKFVIERFSESIDSSKEMFIHNLNLKINEVSSIKLDSNSTNKTTSFLSKRVSIDDETKNLITNVTKITNIAIPDDFFDLGNLENSFYGMADPFGNIILEGRPEEKEKCNLIYKINDFINDFLKMLPFLEGFEKIDFIRFAIKNVGTALDEDVVVELIFPKGVLLTAKDIVNMDKQIYDYISEGGYEIFNIKRSYEYLDYSSSVKIGHYNNFQVLNFPRFINSAIEKDDTEKEDELNGYLDYRILEGEKNDVVSIKFDKVIHNETIAFPSFIMLKKHVSTIEYYIHSKYMPNKISGRIKAVKTKKDKV